MYTTNILSPRAKRFMVVAALLLICLTATAKSTSATVTIAGRIKDDSGVGLDGITVNLTGSFTNSRQTQSGGYYVFSSLPVGYDYIVTPASSSYTFTAINGSGDSYTFLNLTYNIVGVDFEGVATMATNDSNRFGFEPLRIALPKYFTSPPPALTNVRRRIV